MEGLEEMVDWIEELVEAEGEVGCIEDRGWGSKGRLVWRFGGRADVMLWWSDVMKCCDEVGWDISKLDWRLCREGGKRIHQQHPTNHHYYIEHQSLWVHYM